MAEHDQVRWDHKYADRAPLDPASLGPPAEFAAVEQTFPDSGRALDLACGPGRGALWLARRGLDVVGIDISPVAIAQARAATPTELRPRCRFEVADLDHGLPPGPPVDVLLCLRFRDPRLDRAIIDRLAPGGLLAITALSEVGAAPGRFRVTAGELPRAFAELQSIQAGEADGLAWLLARKNG